ILVIFVYLFFFSSRRRHTRSKRDWSSDVCSSDLGDKVTAQYGVLDNHTCVIEMAEASGLKHLAQDVLNPLSTTTYGTGELILHRSEERRVGKECRSRWCAEHYKKKV